MPIFGYSDNGYREGIYVWDSEGYTKLYEVCGAQRYLADSFFEWILYDYEKDIRPEVYLSKDKSSDIYMELLEESVLHKIPLYKIEEDSKMKSVLGKYEKEWEVELPYDLKKIICIKGIDNTELPIRLAIPGKKPDYNYEEKIEWYNTIGLIEKGKNHIILSDGYDSCYVYCWYGNYRKIYEQMDSYGSGYIYVANNLFELLYMKYKKEDF